MSGFVRPWTVLLLRYSISWSYYWLQGGPQGLEGEARLYGSERIRGNPFLLVFAIIFSSCILLPVWLRQNLYVQNSCENSSCTHVISHFHTDQWMCWTPGPLGEVEHVFERTVPSTSLGTAQYKNAPFTGIFFVLAHAPQSCKHFLTCQVCQGRFWRRMNCLSNVHTFTWTASSKR